MTPSDFAKPEVEFNKLDDLPKGRPNTAAEVMKAMAVLHKMIHAQAKHYGGKNSRLLPAGIAEGSLLQQVSAYEEEHLSEADTEADTEVDAELDKAYACAQKLMHHMAKKHDEDGMIMVLELIKHVNRALDARSRH
jgi:hypothetical protein